MKSRDLDSVIALAEELHFGRAADRLGMAQPQLSEMIRRIEENAGVEIFTRRPRVGVTRAGEVIIQMAYRMRRELEAATQRAQSIASGQIGTISLGFSSPVMCGDLTDILRSYLEANAEVELKLVEGTTGPLRDRLEHGELDLVIVREPIWAPDIQTIIFEQDSMNLVLPENHPQAAKDVVALQDLAEDDFVLFSRTSAPRYYDRIVRWCREAGMEPKIRRETDSWVAVLSLVRAGFGVSLGTELLSRIRFQGVTYRPIAGTPMDVSFWMSWSPAKVSPAAARLIEHIRAR